MRQATFSGCKIAFTGVFSRTSEPEKVHEWKRAECIAFVISFHSPETDIQGLVPLVFALWKLVLI